MYGCHYLNKETTFDNKMHLMSLGFVFQFPDLVVAIFIEKISTYQKMLVKEL